MKHPDQADELPWHWFSDPAKLQKWRQRDTEVTRIRQALEAGSAPEESNLVNGGLECIFA